jgi:hypothetical protein
VILYQAAKIESIFAPFLMSISITSLFAGYHLGVTIWGNIVFLVTYNIIVS